MTEATLTRIGFRGSTASNFIPARKPEVGRILKARAGTGSDDEVDKYDVQSKFDPGGKRQEIVVEETEGVCVIG